MDRRRARFAPGRSHHHLLADEINRTPPRTGGALERFRRLGDLCRDAPSPAGAVFFVLATRSDRAAGTYPLPDLSSRPSSSDVGYPTKAEKDHILAAPPGGRPASGIGA